MSKCSGQRLIAEDVVGGRGRREQRLRAPRARTRRTRRARAPRRGRSRAASRPRGRRPGTGRRRRTRPPRRASCSGSPALGAVLGDRPARCRRPAPAGARPSNSNGGVPKPAGRLGERDLVVRLARRGDDALGDPVQRVARAGEAGGERREAHHDQARIQSSSGFAQRSRIPLKRMNRKISAATVPAEREGVGDQHRDQADDGEDEQPHGRESTRSAVCERNQARDPRESAVGDSAHAARMERRAPR